VKIDCTRCEMYRTEQCDDCLVTALLHPPDTEVEIEEDLDSPLETLASAGLVPMLKFRPRAPAPQSDAAESAETG
jgi:hypothetical protein